MELKETNDCVDLQTVVPFATSTNVVSDRRIEWFSTPTSKAVCAFLVQLANGYETTYGPLMSEIFARLSFDVIGFFIAPVFDWFIVFLAK